jgi:hypothetical protein
MQIEVNTGNPFYSAVLVDNTNFTEATWSPYTTSDITVNLGASQGWHDVWIGLKGFPQNATQTWQWKHLNLTALPILTITNPVVSLVDQPVIQIYGYSQEALASISYDVSNALGLLLNQPSEVTDQYFDKNIFKFTTNYFECLDVPLTNGVNTITIHATDLAGNTTSTNFYFTLDYTGKTNPPTVQITWPQNATQISGNSFRLQGTVSDPTVTITTQLLYTNGPTNVFIGGFYTNVFNAAVDRTGIFSFENLPLHSGTNTYTIQFVDAAGNISVTNLTLVQSSLTLTINPVIPDSQLWQPAVNLNGTISATNYAIWVNGVKGHNNGDGTWFVKNVALDSNGTANFTATAYAPSEQQPDGSYGN